MLSLYRRHRPRTFDQVVGQEHIVRTLRNAVELDKVHHAYLFVGSRGTGKTSTAKLLACALNCEGGPRVDFAPDDPACQAIMRGTSLDVVEMDAASNNSVDDIRELRENVGLAPMGGGKRVYILDEAHMLSSSAWNAFLKTLEEPPAHVVFVLATTEAHKVPATIVDRCHRFDFHRPSLEQIAGVLRRVADEEQIIVPDAAVGMIARAATGSFRDALGTLEQLVTYGGSEIRLDDVLEVLGVADAERVLEAAEALVDRDAAAALHAVEHLAASGRDVNQFMRDLTAHLRHLFVVQTLGQVPDSFSVTAGHTDRLASQADRLAQGEVVRAIDLLAAALGAVKDGSDPRIQLELALLKAVQPQADLSLGALVFRLERLEQRLGELSGGAAPAARAPSNGTDPTIAAPAASATAARGADPGLAAPAASASPASGADPGLAAPASPSDVPGAVSVADVRQPVPATSVGPPARQERVAGPAAALATVEVEPEPIAEPEPAPVAAPLAGELDLERLRMLWPAVLDAVRLENGLVGALLQDARPVLLEAGELTVSFPPEAEFSKRKAESNRPLLQAALRGTTGQALGVHYEMGAEAAPAEAPAVLSEDELLARLKSDFGATEVFDDPLPDSSSPTLP